MSSYEEKAVVALTDTAREAYRGVFQSGSAFANRHIEVRKTEDIVQVMAGVIDLIVLAETLKDQAAEAAAKLRNTLKVVMNETGATTIQASHHAGHLARKARVLVVDEDDVPSEFIVPKPMIDRDAIKAAMANGRDVPFARWIVPNEVSLVIRPKEPAKESAA